MQVRHQVGSLFSIARSLPTRNEHPYSLAIKAGVLDDLQGVRSCTLRRGVRVDVVLHFVREGVAKDICRVKHTGVVFRMEMNIFFTIILC